MISPSKSLVIFSHHRSGSTWFQNGLSHFNAFELLNLDISWKSIDHRPEFKNSLAQYYTIDNYTTDLYLGIDTENELTNRFRIYNELESKHAPMSTKVHTCQVNDAVIDFLSSKELDYVLIERKDKISTFWSFIIAQTTLQFHFFQPKTQEITITKEVFKSVSDKMLDFKNEVVRLKKIFPIQHMYYEDILNLEMSDWWVRPNNRIKIQNAAIMTTITNRDEVMNWIQEIDLFNKI
jgi:hypothetical protein